MLLAGEIVLRAVSEPFTRFLEKWADGEEESFRSLSPLVHYELRRQARQYLPKEHTDQTSQGNALVHKTYLGLQFAKQGHFLSFVAHALVAPRLSVNGSHTRHHEHLVLLEKVLQELARLDIRQSRSVELWLLAGSIAEVARMLRIYAATVKRDRATARLWLPATIRPGS